MAKRIQLYTSENVIEEFYDALVTGDANRLRRVHIPKSDVFYVREAIYQDTGKQYTLDHVERAMYLEGMLRRNEVFEPDREREGIG